MNDDVQHQEKKESDYEKLVEDDSEDNASKDGKSIRIDQVESKVEVKGVEEAATVKTPQRSVQQRRPSNVTDIQIDSVGAKLQGEQRRSTVTDLKVEEQKDEELLAAEQSPGQRDEGTRKQNCLILASIQKLRIRRLSSR